MELINYVYLLFIIVYIVDISGVVHSIKKKLWIILNGKNIEYVVKSYAPFDCSKCLVFWSFIGIGIYYEESILYTLLIASIGSYLTYYVDITLRTLYEIYSNLMVKLTGN